MPFQSCSRLCPAILSPRACVRACLRMCTVTPAAAGSSASPCAATKSRTSPASRTPARAATRLSPPLARTHRAPASRDCRPRITASTGTYILDVGVSGVCAPCPSEAVPARRHTRRARDARAACALPLARSRIPAWRGEHLVSRKGNEAGTARRPAKNRDEAVPVFHEDGGAVAARHHFDSTAFPGSGERRECVDVDTFSHKNPRFV